MKLLEYSKMLNLTSAFIITSKQQQTLNSSGFNFAKLLYLYKKMLL